MQILNPQRLLLIPVALLGLCVVVGVLYQVLHVSEVRSTAPGARCTASQAKKQGRLFAVSRAANPKWSACPAESMMNQLYATDPLRRDKTFVNIGANKGYSSAMWMNLWAPEVGITPKTWLEHLDRVKLEFSGKSGKSTKIRFCGVCWDCKEVYSGAVQPNETATSKIQIHSIEAMSMNVMLLKKMQTAVTPQIESKVELFTHHYVASNYTGMAKFPKCSLSQEDCSFAGVPNNKYGHAKYVDVRVVTVDSFMKEHKIDQVEHLKIDTEGWDPLVLQGAEQTLSEGRVRLLEFEYHGINHWANSSACKFDSCFELKDVVHALDKHGYVCYTEGSPTLVRLTQCWHPNYEMHDWANVACVKRTDATWLAVMEKLAAWI